MIFSANSVRQIHKKKSCDLTHVTQGFPPPFMKRCESTEPLCVPVEMRSRGGVESVLAHRAAMLAEGERERERERGKETTFPLARKLGIC